MPVDVKTREQIEELKAQWLADPCWDIEETEGFEQHKEELLKFRLETERRWQRQWLRRINAKARKLRCSIATAEYLIRLEERISKLEERI